MEVTPNNQNGAHSFTTVKMPNETDGYKRQEGSVITFQSINYTLNPEKCCGLCLLPCRKAHPKRILTDISGIFKPGMNAIMGPTGSGKSSLLDVLADRKDRRGLSGLILLNGQPQGSDFKYRVGYVVQDDIVSGNLTVRENLMFSANVRLPKSIDRSRRENIVNEVLSQLGLDKCADTTVGTEFKRGVSGGERKRTNIGMELVLSPEILFLDEPTTGLDSSTAQSVMECLHQLSQRGRTIIFSIHQPRFSIFKLFDSLYLVASGRCVYHGPAMESLNFFSSVGFQCERFDNPADFILDISQGNRLPALDEAVPNRPTHLDGFSIEDYLNTAYTQTEIYQNILKDIDTDIKSKQRHPPVQKIVEQSLINEIFYVSQRTLRNAFRNPQLTILQSVISAILAVLTGLIYLRLDTSDPVGVNNRRGAIFFVVVNQIFSNLSALEIFIKERVLFVHENVSGYYHVITYFISKLLCDILPLRTIPAVAFSVIAYFMMGFQTDVDKFFLFFFGVWLTSVCASSWCFFVSASVQNHGVANIAAALYFVLTMVFGGFLVTIDSVLVVLKWIQYVSIFRYASNILSINEFTGLTFCLKNNASICPQTGDDVLSIANIDHGSSWDLWKNFVALGSMTIGFLVLAYLRLRFMKKTK